MEHGIREDVVVLQAIAVIIVVTILQDGWGWGVIIL